MVSAKGFFCSKFVSSEDPSDQGADGLVEAVKCSFDELGWTWAVANQNCAGLQVMVQVRTLGSEAGCGPNWRVKLN